MRRGFFLLSIVALWMAAVSSYAQETTPAPTPTPNPVSDIRFDEWDTVDIPEAVRDGLSRPYLAYFNENDSETINNLSTAQPTTNRATVYYTNPANPGDTVPIMETEASALEGVFVAPQGNALAYFLNDSAGSRRGLWVVDVSLGFSARVLAASGLGLRGIYSEPAWAPDGRQLAVVLETGYNLDIFAFDLDESKWVGLVRDGSFNFWPAWSPDGRYLAFVSDRATCPSWEPGTPDACNAAVQDMPTGGHVYVLELETGVISRVSQETTSEPPYWIDDDTLGYSTGDPFDLTAPTRALWYADAPAFESQRFRLDGDTGETVYLAESWRPDGQQVVFQRANGDGTEIVVARRDGTRVDTIDQVSFARFAMAAAWSPDGERLSVGGTSGQCPYGVRVMNENFSMIATGTEPSNVCNPIYAPNGEYLAFTGINNFRSTLDGRRDVYVASADGFGTANVSLSLRGQRTLLGWVGPG